VFVLMRENVATPTEAYLAGEIYELMDAIAASFIRGKVATRSEMPPTWYTDFVSRLDQQGKKILIKPFLGEFGHEILYSVRRSYLTKCRHQIICCRKGNEVLYPKADVHFTEWIDPIPDSQRIGVDRAVRPWPDICQRFPDHIPLEAGNLTMSQELITLCPEEKIVFKPQLRGLKADVILGIRHRQFCSQKNFPQAHWQLIADSIHAKGLTFAVAGAAATSLHLKGELFHTGDIEQPTDAAIEAIQNCRLFVSTDTGVAHLAATIGAKMVVWREEASQQRNFIPRMEQINKGNVTELVNVWQDPHKIIAAILESVA
jgi:hypothetical protein